jgi:hypothetical protein
VAVATSVYTVGGGWKIKLYMVIGDEKVYLRSDLRVQTEKKSMGEERIRP